MNLYLIKNDLKQLIYIVASTLENAMELYQFATKEYGRTIDEIRLIQRDILIGE